MTHISFTSGEIFDIISALEDRCQSAEDRGNHHLSAYFLNMVQQFEMITEKLNDLPGEQRVANLVMTL
jgi:hypothetical protein